MELASNLVWLFVALCILGTTYIGVRRGKVRVSMVTAMALAALLCLMLLTTISISDDLLEAHQASLPLSGQTWRMVWEGSVGLELPSLLGALLLLFACARASARMQHDRRQNLRLLSAWLIESQHQLPPPQLAY